MSRQLTYAEALSEGLVQSMQRDDSIFVTGIAVDYPSGMFGTTSEALAKFGKERVFDAPAMENALTGIAIGAAAMGKRPVIVHPRNDFMFLAMDQLLNLASKWSYMYGGNAGRVPIVVRGIIGKGWGQGATHSQSLHAVLAHFPGLQVVLPSAPADAKQLTIAALTGTAPTVILEHRALYGDIGEVPEDFIAAEVGKARILREGSDVTIVATSLMAREALTAASELEKYNISVEVIDPRWIRPLDTQTICNSIRKTGRLIAADITWENCGFASEVAAMAVEKCFRDLVAPVRRITLPDCPAPVSLKLEEVFYPKASTLAKAALSLFDRREDGDLEQIDASDQFKGPY